MLPYYRRTLIPGLLDSVQGLLEVAEWYNDHRVIIEFAPGEILDLINQLKEEGYVVVSWEAGSKGNQRLAKLGLTIKGHEHLFILRQRSKSGQLKRSLVDMMWIILVSVLTTLATLQINGCAGTG